MDYIAHALSQGDELGKVIFDGFLRISDAQGHNIDGHGVVRDDLDPLWATINPLILRVGAFILRKHIERHLPEPFYAPNQLQRWDCPPRGTPRALTRDRAGAILRRAANPASSHPEHHADNPPWRRMP